MTSESAEGVAEGVAGMVTALVGELKQHRGVVVAEAAGQGFQPVIVGLRVGDFSLQRGTQIVSCGVKPSKGNKDVDRCLHVSLGLGSDA